MWRVVNPRQFFETNRTLSRALQRIDDVTYDNLRAVLAQQRLSALLSSQRDEILRLIAERSDEELAPHGIRIADLRIRSIDFPEGNLEPVFLRMRYGPGARRKGAPRRG